MHVETTGSRTSAVYLWGALLVLAWAVLTALVGGGEAHADDESGGILTPVVKTTTAAVKESTETVAGTVAQTAESALKTAEGGERVTSWHPIDAIVTPVTDAVREVPIVGAALDELGATDVVEKTPTGLDQVREMLAPVVDRAVDPVIDSLVDPAIDGLQPGIPDAVLPLIPDAGLQTGPATTTAKPSAVAPTAPVGSTASGFSGVTTASAGRVDASNSTPPSGDPGGAPTLAPGATTSAGNGGPAPGANSDAPSSASHIHSISIRAGIPSDIALPPSPAGSTDVSPD